VAEKGTPAVAEFGADQVSRRRGAPGTIGLLEQLPGVVFNGDHDAGALVETLVVVRRQVEDAVGAGDVLGVFQRLAQGAAELDGTRLGSSGQPEWRC
jgi:hypothetical protein